MHSYSPCSCWYILECSGYCTFFEVQYFMIAIVIWTCLTVFFLGGCSKYYIVTSSVCCCFVCYFDCRTTYFYVCDHWCIWCNCCYFEFLSFRPLTKYFLSVCITCPSVAVCIVSSLLYILERCRCAYLIFVYRNIIFVCDAIFICRDYIIITSSAFCFTERITVALFPTTLTSLIIGAPTSSFASTILKVTSFVPL
jgi:hypothetical protein